MKKFALALILLASPAFAQQQPDPAFLQKAIAVLQQQRNAAMDAQASAEARAAGLAEELAKAKARIQEIEKAQATPAAK